MNDYFGAVIPALNEISSIASVIRGAGAIIPRANIIVVDDGSVDGTAAAAAAEGVEVLHNPSNMGKGASLIAGFSRLMLRREIEAVFTLDADGQHDPGEMPLFIDAYRTVNADIVIGSRMADTGGMPVMRRISNRLTSFVISIRVGRRIEDSQSGFRLIRAALLRRLDLKTRRFDTESEILIRAGLLGATVTFVPIRTIYGGERSSIRPTVDTLRFFRLVLRSYFW